MTSEIIFILNDKNKQLTLNIINSIFEKYNIKYKLNENTNIDLFVQALTHPSYSINVDNYNEIYNNYKMSSQYNKNMIFVKQTNYERLEFLGDSFIKPVISSYIYFRYPDAQEGFMSTLRTKIESTKTLAYFSKCLGLDKFILLSQTLEQEGNRQDEKILEDCFEAFIGALYINDTCGILSNNSSNIFNVIKELTIKLIEHELNLTEFITDRNYKDELNRYCHKEKYPLPRYKTSQIKTIFNEETSKQEKMYFIVVEVNGKTYGPTQHTSKKIAEQNAAQLAITDLTHDDNNDECVYVIGKTS